MRPSAGMARLRVGSRWLVILNSQILALCLKFLAMCLEILAMALNFLPSTSNPFYDPQVFFMFPKTRILFFQGMIELNTFVSAQGTECLNEDDEHPYSGCLHAGRLIW